MYNRNLFYFVCIALLSTTIYGLTKNELTKFKCSDISYGDSGYYCKDDMCASFSDYRVDFTTIIIPNKEGQNTTYIIDTCSSTDINLDICTSKECTSDSQYLSNKCIKGHCSFNEANPIVHCQCARTVHNNPIFGDPKGYKMICGSPKGYKCKSNSDCSSYNCYGVCGDPDDSGCHSACGIGGFIVFLTFGPFVVAILISSCIYCNCVYKKRKYKVKKKKWPNNNKCLSTFLKLLNINNLLMNNKYI